MTSSVIEDFYSSLPFEPDDFQRQAIAATETGATVVVTAPTGSGKTLVAEAAVVLALAASKRAFYTTPIKALSNQKYGDLVEVHGKDRVGLLTGDNVINGDAAVVVMTTEVLRNMIYAGSDALDRVAVVILDEVHYLQDRFRGAVWEEIIIHAPRRIQLVCLSATVANAEEFAAWIEERRGKVELIVSKHRPIPLEDLYCWRDRFAQELAVMPTFVSRGNAYRANPKIERLLSLERGRRHRFSTPKRSEVIEHLAEAGLLPAIYFIFSRAGCDAAALRLLESGVRLTSADDRERIRLIAEEGTAHLGEDDLDALEYDRWVTFLEAGIAPHHAGMVPAFKETVEELFAAGFLKVVFATETLALGINMPARTVVLESLSKWSGDGHEVMSAGDYTQLTGRAGRRGIDTAGFGMVLHSPFVPFAQVVEVAAAGSHPLRSSFRPTYNMAANLCANYDRPRALELVSSSFAQFQRQESQAQAEERLQLLSARLVEEEARAECELGSVTEYRSLLATRPRRSENDDLIGRLRPGDVIDVPGGPRQGRFLILRRIRREGGGMKLLALGTSGRTVPLGKRELVRGTSRQATLTLPQPMDTKSRRFQSDALRLLRKVPTSAPAGPDEVPAPEIDHPVARCPDRDSHLRWAARAERTRQRVEGLRSELRRSGIGLVEDFEAIERLLEHFDYMSGWALTPRGERLRFVYNEVDLLLAEALERGLFYGLTVPELAALASCFVYEPRSDEKTIPLWPTPELARRWETVVLLSSEIAGEERRQHLPATREPDPGFVGLAYQWADGSALDDLTGLRLAPGDFVRVARQLVDLLRQIRDVSPELADDARDTLTAVDRGVVAAMGVG
ncbi:MAG TPA: DEAD/DEAH box helicase [Acidimicrobiia bacterium]|nr:DEAD/DEAH box helicase [Acidimicrobiia bacterium]